MNLNLTAITPGADGYLRVWAEGEAEPTSVSTLSYQSGQTQSNLAMIAAQAPATGKINVRNVGTATVGLLVASEGWFDPYFAPEPNALLPGGPGIKPYAAYTDFALSERMLLRADAVTGNLVMSSQDIGIADRGQTLSVTRYYNSRANSQGAFGDNWTFDGAGDVRLVPTGPSGADRMFFGPSGTRQTFVSNGAGGWITPPGLTATLAPTAGGYSLRMDREGESYLFNTSGQLVGKADRNGNTQTYVLLPDGRVDKIVDARGRQLVFTWQTGLGVYPRVSRITDGTGRQWNYTYGGSRLNSYTNPLGETTDYTYGSQYRLALILDARGTVARFLWDLDNRVLSIDRPYAGDSGGPTYLFAYQNGRTRVQDPNDGVTSYLYDYLGRVTDVFNPLGEVQSNTYDANSNIIAYTPATGQATDRSVTNTYSTDGRNNLLTSQLSTGAAGTYEYTQGNNQWSPSKVTDSQGSASTFAYDVKGNLSSTSNSLATVGTTSVVRNPDGSVSTSTNARGVPTNFGYNALGELTSIDHPAPLGDESFTYDALSRVITHTDGKGQLSTYSYDALDRVTLIVTGSLQTSYSYDVAGNRLTEVDGSGTDTSTYDRHNRVVTESSTTGQSATYAYDGLGNLLSFSSALGAGPTDTWSYAYTPANLVEQITEPNGALVAFGYDANGARVSTTYPGGTVETTTRDDSGRPTRITAQRNGTALTDVRYTYTTIAGQDQALVQSRTDQVGIGAPTGSRLSYVYDALSRVTVAEERSTSNTVLARWNYAYDAMSNRTNQVRFGSTGTGTSAGTTTYVYNNTDQLTSINGVAANLSYDAVGSELSNPGMSSVGFLAALLR